MEISLYHQAAFGRSEHKWVNLICMWHLECAQFWSVDFQHSGMKEKIDIRNIEESY